MENGAEVQQTTADAFWKDPAWRWALGIAVGMRVSISALAAALVWLHPLPTTPDEMVRPYRGVMPIVGGAAELLLGVWQRFDANWYLHIATQGYTPGDGTTVYFPLYPALMRLLGDLLAGNHLVAGLIISTVAYAGALYYLFVLTRRELGGEAARRATVYLALFPTAFFFLAVYNESLFLLLVLAAFYYARQDRPWLAGGLGFLAALTRLQGVILLLPLGWILLRHKGFQWRMLGWTGLSALLVPLGTILFLAFQRYWMGEASMLQTYEGQLYARFVLPWDNILASVRVILSPEGSFIDLLNLLITFLFIALVVAVWKKLPKEYGIYSAFTLLALMLRMTTLQPLVSMSRYVLAIFPAFMLMGAWGGNPWVNRLILYPSIALLIYLMGQFILWGWVA